ncbi:MAG TPA: Fe-S protein assembly co-chaperone HscB [Vicinamibacterales bacterium]|jgi:molecular chaperone HscB
MSSQATTRTLQVCRNCGGGAPVDVHFCPQCSQILTIGRHGDYFAFLGVPRKLNLDAADLEQRFRTLSRQFHPDYFYNATPAERRASLERSSYLNDAYRTLKNPIARVEYLLGLEGFSARAAGDHNAEEGAKVPAQLLEEVFALNEELDEVRDLRTSGAAPAAWRTKLERARAPIEAKQAAHEAELTELSARWDALGADGGADGRKAILGALRDCVLERNYISNLLEGIERELTQ